MNRGHKQTDLIIMDIAKAFDKVPHRRLLHKLNLLFFHKMHSGTVSIEKDKYLNPAHSLKSTRASHSAQYCRYQTYSDPLKNSFFPGTIPQWNDHSPSRAFDHRLLGPKFCPIPNAKKYVFFPNSRQKIPNLTKKIFFFWFFIFISYNTNKEHIVTYLQFHRIIEYNHTYFFIYIFS